MGQLAGANALAQLLPLLAAPLLTRLYAPEHFTVLAVFGSALSLALAVATMRFDWSVPNARSQGLAAALVMLGLLALVAAAALLTVLLWWGPQADPSQDAGAEFLALPGWAAALLPLALLGGGLQQLLHAWQVRAAALAPAAWSKLVQGATGVAIPLLAAAWLPQPLRALGLVAGLVAGLWLALLPFVPRLKGLWRGLLHASTRHLGVAWARFGREALWSCAVSVLNAASFALLPLLLLRHHSAVEVGWWALVYRVALGPVGLVTSAVSQGFWAEAALLVRSDLAALDRLYRRNTRRLLLLGLALAAVALAGPLYMGPLFGATQWREAGWVLAASAPLVAGIVAGSPLSHLVIHGRQHWQAAWDAARIALVVLAVEGCAFLGAGLVVTVGVVCSALAAMYGVLVALNLRALRAARRPGPEPSPPSRGLEARP